MGRGSKKLVRVIFCGNKSSCPECSFMGNRLQVKLHIKMTHKMIDSKFIINPNSGAIYVELNFSTEKKFKNIF